MEKKSEVERESETLSRRMGRGGGENTTKEEDEKRPRRRAGGEDTPEE